MPAASWDEMYSEREAWPAMKRTALVAEFLLLFASRYAQTSSLATSSFEHALYGCWLFSTRACFVDDRPLPVVLPPGLKPLANSTFFGTTEVVPFQSINSFGDLQDS